MFQEILAIGNLGKNPELRYLPDGREVCSFSMATNKKYQKDGQWKTDTTWFNVVIYGALAKRCAENFHKGTLVMVKGEISPRTWESDGVKHEKWEVTARVAKVLNDNQDQGGNVSHGASDIEPF
jgi:single-strand DNA-binding protein